MAGRRNQILILEDDEGLLQVLLQAFQKQGHTVFGTARPSEAEDLIAKNSIGMMFVDCLLPEMSGVDFCTRIREKYSSAAIEAVLMSGVFTDPNTVKESLRQSGAQTFLKKPFELKDALALLPVPTGVREKEESHPRRLLYQLFGKGKVTAREKKKAIEALDEIHGYDLPFLYSLLVENRTTGHLNIATSKGVIYGISFSKGHIVQTDVPDKESYLGKLLTELGFLRMEDLTEGLATSQQSGRRLGDSLIQDCIISPHALDLALAHQMGLRLAMTISDQTMTVNFVEAEVELTNPTIDPDVFTEFLHDWIVSKISASWLKNHFMQWGDSTLTKTPLFDSAHPALKRPLVAKLENFIGKVTDGSTLNEIIDKNFFPEEAFYKGLHFLLTKGLIGFGGRVRNESIPERVKGLKKIKAQFQGKTKVEIFEVMAQMVGGSESDPDFVLDEFARLMGAIPAQGNSELNNLYKEIRKQAEDSHAAVKSGEATLIREQKAKGDMEKKLKSAAAFEEARNNLERGMYKPALDALKKIQEIDPHLDRLRLYLIWAKVGTLEGALKKDKLIEEIEMDLLQVPPHEKLEPLYHFASGLLAKARDQGPNAKKLFEKVLTMDAEFMPARRELNHLKTLEAQRKDVLNRDLKDIVGSFFKRK